MEHSLKRRIALNACFCRASRRHLTHIEKRQEEEGPQRIGGTATGGSRSSDCADRPGLTASRGPAEVTAARDGFARRVR